MEGVNGSCLVRNLSTHLAANEKIAQNLLLHSEANRRVAETPLNKRSSRSHAIFTIQLASRKHNSDVIVRYACINFRPFYNFSTAYSKVLYLSESCIYMLDASFRYCSDLLLQTDFLGDMGDLSLV